MHNCADQNIEGEKKKNMGRRNKRGREVGGKKGGEE
jgi:hypothetical protein